MNSLMVFEGNDVEVFEFEGRALFNPKDVGKCLMMEDSTTRKAIGTMSEKQVVKLSNSIVKDFHFRKLHNTGENFLTESGVYKLIMRSNKPEAERFQDWVTDDVLPSIRQRGHYTSNSELATQNAITDGVSNITNIATLDLVQMLITGQKELIEKNSLLETKIEEDKPLVEYANNVLKSSDCILIREMAKLLYDEGIDIGERKLYQKLRDWGLIFKSSTEPMQSAVNSGIFVVEQYTVTTPFGIKLNNVTKITPKGQLYIVDKFKKQ